MKWHKELLDSHILEGQYDDDPSENERKEKFIDKFYDICKKIIYDEEYSISKCFYTIF